MNECFSEPCATQTLSQYLDQYNVDLGHFGTFKVSDNSKLTLCYSKYAKNPYYKAMFLQCITL